MTTKMMLQIGLSMLTIILAEYALTRVPFLIDHKCTYGVIAAMLVGGILGAAFAFAFGWDEIIRAVLEKEGV